MRGDEWRLPSTYLPAQYRTGYVGSDADADVDWTVAVAVYVDTSQRNRQVWIPLTMGMGLVCRMSISISIRSCQGWRHVVCLVLSRPAVGCCSGIWFTRLPAGARLQG